MLMNRMILSVLFVALSLHAQPNAAAVSATARYYVVFLRPDPARKPLGEGGWRTYPDRPYGEHSQDGERWCAYCRGAV
jgi:hypothetical protein